ncbi:MAG: hypothetical protein H0V14_03955 [Chitinophagaceae bacterium]|nr:hypothetical protein [Chitinophagaceae bacterium]
MKLILSYLFIAVSLGFIGINLSCNNNYNEAQPSFYYYPKVNVYYDATRANYIYSLDSGKTWDSMDDKLNKAPTTLGKEVIIDSPVSEVWKANEMHRKLYGGTLLNIISADTGIVVKKAASKKVTQINKTNIDTTNTEASQKKPRKGFFRKIFGKKNKKDS